MIISLIVAMDEGRIIGKDNRVPWHLPADMGHFRRLTVGKPVIMGRKTFQSIGRPLPERTNIVLTRDPHFKGEGCLIVHSPEEAIKKAGEAAEVMIIGGAEIYKLFLPKAERIYLTEVHAHFPGDTYFPQWKPEEWREVERQDFHADKENPHPYSFVTLERLR